MRADQQHAGEQAEAAEGGDDERHARAVAAAGLRCQKPMSMKEKTLVISQKTTSIIRLPESTIPPMAPMKARSQAKNRAAGSFGDR